MSHHTEKEVKAAFAVAPTILKELENAGLDMPSIQLFSDASGTLELRGGGITPEMMDTAINTINSHRIEYVNNEIHINFCCGLVTAAREKGLL